MALKFQAVMLLNANGQGDHVILAHDYDEMVAIAAEAIEAEVRRRDEWYGLDNWTFEDVADYVLKAAFQEPLPKKP